MRKIILFSILISILITQNNVVSGDFFQEKIQFRVKIEPESVNHNLISNQTYIFNISITNLEIDPVLENISATKNFTPITGNMTIRLSIRKTSKEPKLLERQNRPDELAYGNAGRQEEETYIQEFPIPEINETKNIVFRIDFTPLEDSDEVWHEVALMIHIFIENTIIDNEHTRTTNDIYDDWKHNIGYYSTGYILATPRNIEWISKTQKYFEENEDTYEQLLEESSYEMKEIHFSDGFINMIHWMKQDLIEGDYRNARGNYQWIQPRINFLTQIDELYPIPIVESLKHDVNMTLDKAVYSRFDDIYVTINNTGASELHYGWSYWFEKMENGHWQKVQWDKAVPLSIEFNKPFSSKTFKLSHPSFTGGYYRLCKRVWRDEDDKFVLKTDFMVKSFPILFLDFAWGNPYWMFPVGLVSILLIFGAYRLLYPPP